VIKRENDTLIKGFENIEKYYLNAFYNNAKATWKPDFIAVSDDGTMAYSYGNYNWVITDTVGKTSNYPGVYITI